MPLSEDLRNELAAITPTSDCDRLAELSGLAHSAGSVHLLGRGEVSVHLDLASNAVARRTFGILRAFGVEAEIRTYRRRAFDRSTRYQVHVPGTPRAQEVLKEAGILDQGLRPAERPPRRVVGRACCRAAYLRGALLGGGSLSGPRSASPRDPDRIARRRGVPRVARAARRPRPWEARDRVRESGRDDRGRARRGRRERRRARARRARGRRRDALARQPSGERRPRQSGPFEPCRARAGPGGPSARRRGAARPFAARAPGNRRAPARSSLALAAGSSRSNVSRRRRKPLLTGGCGPSSDSPKLFPDEAKWSS